MTSGHNLNKGFGIIEALVALIIVTTIAELTAKLVEYSMLSANMTEARNGATSIMSNIATLIQEKNSCTAALTHTSQYYNSDISFYMPDGIILTAGSNNSGLNVATLTYTSTFVRNGHKGSKIYYGALNVKLEALKPVLGPKAFKDRQSVNFFITTDSSGVIKYCGTVAPHGDDEDDKENDNH